MAVDCYVHPPNRPMSTTFECQTRPTMYKDLMFLELDDPRILVSSCNVTATFWEGSLQIFPDLDGYVSQQHEAFYNGGLISSAKFLSDNYVLIAESEAKLLISAAYEHEYGSRLEPIFSTENCEPVKQLALWPCNKTSFLALSNEHVTLWDIASDKLEIVANYTDYHTDTMNAIDTNKEEKCIFATASRDRRVCIWDTRMEQKAMQLYNNSFCSFTSVAWNLKTPTLLAAGTQGGNLYLLDVKQPKQFLSVQSCYKKGIFKLQFNKENKLAVVGDTNELQVYKLINERFELCYNNLDQHKRFIRDAQWTDNDCNLLTCGLDSKIVKHTL